MRPRLNVASALETCCGRACLALAVDSGLSGTSATKASPISRGSRTARTAPRTNVAQTRPPTTEAAAFSGWPSTDAATASGSLAPAAAAAAAANAADDPRPARHRDLGADRDGESVRSGHVDGHPCGEVGVVGREVLALSFAPHGQALGRLHLDLDVQIERQRQGVEART